MANWDERFMELAKHVASWSKDPSTKVGAIIVDDNNRVVSMGYNGFPRGVEDLEERYNDRETKLKFVCHAERNAIDQSPKSVEGCYLVSTLFPCNECTKSIIQSGIAAILTTRPLQERNTVNDLDVSLTMLEEAGVDIYYV